MKSKKTVRQRPSSNASPSAEFKRSLPATTAGTERVLKDILKAFTAAKLSCGDTDEICLALREALNNAVRHGSSLDPEKRVHVAWRWHPRAGLWVMVRDEGRGFDPGKIPDPTKRENLERPGGRGLYMISKLMDRVEFRDEGREIHMWRRPRP